MKELLIFMLAIAFAVSLLFGLKAEIEYSKDVGVCQPGRNLKGPKAGWEYSEDRKTLRRYCQSKGWK